MGKRSVRRLLLLQMISVFLAAAVAQESAETPGDPAAPAGEAFAGLTVVAHGEQVVDIFTGVTTLPEGGEIIDREHGTTLVAERIRYLEGEFVEAEEVRVSGDFGVANADEVYVDLAGGRLDASGEVRYERDELGLKAKALHYFPASGVVSFEGPVTGLGADFEAASAFYDATAGVLVLAAPYRYRDVLFELSSERQGALLSLTPPRGETGAMVASSSVAPEVRERLGPYLITEEQEDGAGGANESSQP